MSTGPADYRDIAYSRYGTDVRPDYARFADAYARRLSGKLTPEADWRCLDLACGYGNFLAYLRHVGVRDYVGFDGAEPEVLAARREFGEAHVMAGDVVAFLRNRQGTYRLLSGLDFIEHLDKQEVFRFLALARDALEPGGYLLLRTPNAGAPFGMAARYNDITQEVCFTTNAIVDTLARSGLESAHIWEDIPRPHTPRQALHWLSWQVARFALRLANAAETGSWGDGILTRNMWVLARKPGGGA
ncbi:MAG: class I SAM-dependent methyltransferase [Betaproteobacteria bacterium]|nr:class I SAM-dependent methyltransferase [Betaproteobacteria bacterium]